jgi:MSHA biogenesis protein MshN
VSVINQMLKDLEQRTPEQGQAAIPLAVSHKPSTIKIVLISMAVLVSLNLLGLYIWNLQEQVTSSELKLKIQVQSPVTNAGQNTSQQSVETLMPDQETLEREKSDRQPSIAVKISPTDTKADSAIELSKQSTVKEKANLPKPILDEIAETNTRVQSEPIKPKLASTKTVSPVAVSSVIVSSSIARPILVNTPSESKMSVSRRQLTSKELVAQKLVRAKKSIKINNITKAEQLFEEVLIVEPNHKQARKNLAALWFGRKSYQQATNLLSQGISLDRNDAELRKLKARIHLQQEQYNAAYNTLKPLSQLKQQEYQVMFANVSQQIEQYESAIQAYEILIGMQGYSGRWHLGLAIVYDKNSQFTLAVTEYALALTKSDLSVASAKFAQQRMQVLGE